MTVGDVREDIARQEWEMALGVLIEIGDLCPVPVAFWEFLAEAARQITLSLMGPEEGGRRSAFAGDGRLRPLWDIGGGTADGHGPDRRGPAAPNLSPPRDLSLGNAESPDAVIYVHHNGTTFRCRRGVARREHLAGGREKGKT
ncbi:hypothetical protein GCM10009837_81820 [Streptomyces durmitorensis]|uniref:Uncharacterized protein n=1 Tax=Streptomyces durmitorensis TaxID=319947 RepID=A0ABY4Q7L4_9ACTN|nr:hypothetical protein [Streptomyces durmitorensis]UQT61137.1 hypothetical protein M4V62_42055 [Streptomyces durmitorensis]